MRSSGKRPLTRNLRFCFQWLPWAFVAIWASVTPRMSSHSSCVGSGRSHTVFCCSSRRRRSRFSSISFRLARRLLSSNTTGGTTTCLQQLLATAGTVKCLYLQNHPLTGAQGHWSVLLTVCRHANSDAFLEATFLALVAGDFVNDTLALVLARVCRVQVLLNCASKKPL